MQLHTCVLKVSYGRHGYGHQNISTCCALLLGTLWQLSGHLPYTNVQGPKLTLPFFSPCDDFIKAIKNTINHQEDALFVCGNCSNIARFSHAHSSIKFAIGLVPCYLHDEKDLWCRIALLESWHPTICPLVKALYFAYSSALDV